MLKLEDLLFKICLMHLRLIFIFNSSIYANYKIYLPYLTTFTNSHLSLKESTRAVMYYLYPELSLNKANLFPINVENFDHINLYTIYIYLSYLVFYMCKLVLSRERDIFVLVFVLFLYKEKYLMFASCS